MKNEKRIPHAVRRGLLAYMVLAAFQLSAATLTFTGASLKPVEITADKNTGLEAIYVINDLKGVTASYSFSGDAPTWQRFSSMGGGYAEDVKDVVVEGNLSILKTVEGDCGYIVTDGGRQYCFWVVDYSKHTFHLTGASFPEEQYCESTAISVSGSGAPIHYYTVDGRNRVLSRDIKVAYTTQKFDESTKEYDFEDVEKTLESVEGTIVLTPAIYCRTTVTISGDRFQEQWHKGLHVTTDTFHPNAIEVNSAAEQEGRSDEDVEEGHESNIISANTDGLGGSAPAEITFMGRGTEAMIHPEWQFSSDPNFDNITYRFNQEEVTYTFLEEGTTYVRFVGSNADGSCEQEGETYTVSIASSELRCPNAFSPGTSEGVNDEWKVSYRSIVDFECWIFDRYGNELYHFTDPNQGWDGKRGGKVVKPGVYYYVINARGADGKHYKKSGDINIMGYKGVRNSGGIQE